MALQQKIGYLLIQINQCRYYLILGIIEMNGVTGEDDEDGGEEEGEGDGPARAGADEGGC